MDANSTTYPMPEIVDRDVNHEASIAAARKAAAEAGVGERVRFEVADAAGCPATATTWGASSTACMTWATRSGRPVARVTRWPATGRSCWSSPSGRRAGRKPEPGEQALLRRLGIPVHAQRTGPGRRACARRAGG